MYKVLLADDEGIVTDSLKYIIEKNFGSACETAVAKNGRQAIELAESFQPDIAFLDIQMPGLNGLKVMEEIRAQNIKMKVLILTAYDNVDYAKEALRLGAVDYLTKPINKKVIVERLTGMMHTIDGERQKRRDDLIVKEKMEAVIPIIENGFIISLIIQNEYEDSGKQYRSLLNLEEDYGIIMALEWGNGREGAGMGNPVGSGVRAHKYYDKMAELVKVYFKAFVSEIMGNKMICVIPSVEPQLAYENRLQLIERARSLVTSLKHTAGIDFKAGIGSVKSWEDMFDSYQEALNALRHGKRNVTHIDDLIVKDDLKKQRQVMEQEVLKAVLKGVEHDVRQEAAVFASWELKNQNSTFEEQRLQLMELLLLARRTVQEQGGEPAKGAESIGELLTVQGEEDLRQKFVAAMVELTQAVVIRNQEPDSIITRAKDYIQQNFRRDLTLEEVAQTVGISPYYFSKLFKEEADVNFSEYLTEIRIETAKRLLSEREMSIKQVCIDSGYANPNYFSRIFKKWVGITPTEFRDAIYENR
ncbi:MAG: response regulator [Lachnospiraceae bacterium]|nr:response regulator [Lachnospiraceae bacterium]